MTILAQQYPVFQPALRVVSTITNANPAVVTTTFPHQYITGSIVRINIPLGYGMQQINQMVGEITVTGTTTFQISIDSTSFSAFSVPATQPANQQYVTVVPVGEDNNQLTAAVQNVLPYAAI
jgi:tryptophanyl-tRNA synthetase